MFGYFFLFGVFLLGVSGPGPALYGAFYWGCGRIRHPSTFHQPIMCSEGWDLGGLAEEDTRQGRGGAVTHSSLGRSPILTVCVCLCVCESRKGSGIGHQMVTVWAGPQQARKRGGQCHYSPFVSVFDSHTHTRTVIVSTHTARHKPCE